MVGEKNWRPLRQLQQMGALLVAALLIGGACFLAGRSSGGKEEEPMLSAAVVQSSLTEVRELASVAYYYTNMAQFENSNDFYGVKIPFTTKRFILTYDGSIKAGVDLSQAVVEVEGASVQVRLPPACILSHEIYEDSMELFDEKTSIFNPFTVKDFTAFRAEQKKVMEEKAAERGLLEEADAKAADAVRSLLASSLPEETAVTVLTGKR